MLNLDVLTGPVLVFGGPYSNVHASRAIQEEASRLGVIPNNVICTGDIVAYCADPEPTVDLIRNWGCQVVMGNCEESIGNQEDDCGCGFEQDTLCSLLSVEWYRYAATKINPEHQAWMRSLPRVIRFQLADKKFAVIHGGVDNISEFIFASSDRHSKQNWLDQLGVDCIIGGHCGLPFGNNLGTGFWLNAGVIGMPANDGSRDGWYLFLQPQEKEIIARWHRLPFDTGCAVAAMENAGLGSAYKDALISGIWPSMEVLPADEQSQQGQYLTPAPMLLS